jgi:uncharacterized membrane protein YfhO
VNGTSAEITGESLTGVQLKATGPGRLTLRDRNMKGWSEARVDGQSVPVQGTTWQEIDLPAGEHQIEFRYTPPGYPLGAMVSLFGWLAWAGALILVRRAPKKTEESSE